MTKPPLFEDIIKQPLTDAEKAHFLAEQYIMRDIIWHSKHTDLFSQVGLFNG